MHKRNSGWMLFASFALVQSLNAQSQWPTNAWPSTTPRAVGLDPAVLAALDADIAAGKYGYIDGMLVIRHGKVAYERSYQHAYDEIYREQARTPGALNAHDATGPYNYFNPWWHPFYHRTDLHTMQSVTKTVTSVVIGAAIARHEFPDLDTPVLRFFDTSKVANLDDRKRRMTIRHLLTMTAGLDWDEDVPYADPKNASSLMEASFDWVQFTIDRPMAQDPGAAFKYNSGATQLLSHIFSRATGKDIEEYAQQHLFAPLGIERFHWKRSPSGLADTEGGLYLRPRDVAKICYLFLKGGVWDGKMVVRPEWVKASLAPSVTVSDMPNGSSGAAGGAIKYGFKWWLYSYGTGATQVAWGGSGFGGQQPLVVPEKDLIVVFTGWNILPDSRRLAARVAIERILRAVID